MIKVRIDASRLLESMQLKLDVIQDKERMLRTIAVGLQPEIKHRVHQQGLDANDKPIGKYSEAYMRVRTGRFLTNQEFKSGKRKGETKPTGVFTKGKNKGKPRPQYNRSNDPAVVASLTRKMENNFIALATDRGYGLGYTNPDDRKKAGYVEATYHKKIFSLTAFERQKAVDIAIDYLENVTP